MYRPKDLNKKKAVELKSVSVKVAADFKAGRVVSADRSVFL